MADPTGDETANRHQHQLEQVGGIAPLQYQQPLVP
eukprot:gene16715-22753_t